MSYLVNFDSKNHTAFAYSCNDRNTVSDAMSFFNDRIFKTETEMAKSPEVQAYNTYFAAALSLSRFNNEAVYNQLMAEANAWKQSAIDNQVKLDDGVWLVDDGFGRIYHDFSDQHVNVSTEAFCGYTRVSISIKCDDDDNDRFHSYSRTFLATEIIVDLGIITITVDNGDKIYLRLPKE